MSIAHNSTEIPLERHEGRIQEGREIINQHWRKKTRTVERGSRSSTICWDVESYSLWLGFGGGRSFGGG